MTQSVETRLVSKKCVMHGLFVFLIHKLLFSCIGMDVTLMFKLLYWTCLQSIYLMYDCLMFTRSRFFRRYNWSYCGSINHCIYGCAIHSGFAVSHLHYLHLRLLCNLLTVDFLRLQFTSWSPEIMCSEDIGRCKQYATFTNVLGAACQPSTPL